MREAKRIPIEQAPHPSSFIGDFYNLLSIDERERLLMGLTFYDVPRGGVIYNKEEGIDSIYILVKGQGKIVQNRERPQVMQLLKNGDIFGFVPYFTHNKYETEATCITDSIVGIYPVADFERLLLHNAEASLYFLRDVSDQFWSHHTLLISLTQKHLRGRLADAIKFIEAEYGIEADGMTLKGKFSRNDYSELCAMTSSNVTRTLRDLESEGIIALRGKDIALLNRDKLDRVSRIG